MDNKNTEDRVIEQLQGKKESFGTILARERKRLGISLYELSDMLGKDEEGKPLVSASYLSRIEKSERDNPTIKVVALLTAKLSLDFREVLKTYGYEDILPTNLNKELDEIEEIIRLSNIKVPAVYKRNVDTYEYLSQDEKEILINIISEIFLYRICHTEAITYHIIQILSELELLREARQNSIKKEVDRFGKNFTIVFGGDIKYKLRNLGIGASILFAIIEDEIDEEMIAEEGDSYDFYIHNSELKIVIGCEKVDNTIRVVSISDRIRGK